MYRHFRARCLLLLVGVFMLAAHAPLSAQAVKVDPKKKGSLLVPDPFEIKPGDPLSKRTPVARPAAIKGAQSWTVETKIHRWTATALALSPDGKMAATGGYDGMIRLWDIPSGKLLRVLVGHDWYVYGLAFSPDGSVLASTGSHDGTARIWNPKTGMTLRVLRKHKGYTYGVAWSPDGSTLVVSGGTSGFATFWNPVKPEQIRTVEVGTGILCSAWSPDGKYLATGSTQGCVVWTAADGENYATLRPDGNVVYSVAWSPDSKQLLTGGGTNSVVWNIDTKEAARTVPGQVTAAHWASNGKWLATSARVGMANLTDPETTKLQRQLKFRATHFAANKENTLLAAIDGTHLHIQDVTTDASPTTFLVAASDSMVYTPGKPVVSGLTERELTFFDTSNGKKLHVLEGHTGAINSALWSRDGKFLATSSADKTARVWDGASGKVVQTLADHQGAVSAVAWASDGKLATGGADKTVRVFAPNSDNVLHTLNGHTHPVTALGWSRDGKSLVSGSVDRNLIVWNLMTNKPFLTLSAIHDVQTLAISPDGRLVASGGTDDVIRIFSLANGKLLYSLDLLGNPRNVISLAFSPDSTMLAAGRANHTMQVWSIGTDKPLHNVQVMAPVHSVAWSNDGKTFITAALDRSLRFWDQSTGLVKVTMINDGRQLAAIAAEGHYRVLPDLEHELLYVVQTDKTQDTYDPRAFAVKFAWRNNAAAVKP